MGSIIGGAFGLVRERPRAVAVWGLLYLAATVGMALAMRPLFGRSGLMSRDPQMAAASVSSIMGPLLLLQILSFALMVVLFAASQRAVLQPEREGFAYLRLGMDELRLFGLGLFLLILFYVGFLVAALVLALLGMAVVLAAGPGAAIPLAFAGILAILGAAFWLQVRLSLSFPLTLLRGKFVIGESWRITRSRFWTLFGAYFVLFLLMLVLWIAVGVLTAGSYFAELASSGFTPEGIEAAAQRQMARQFGEVNAMAIIGWVASAVAGTLAIALFGGAIATAALELTTDVEALADTFA